MWASTHARTTPHSITMGNSQWSSNSGVFSTTIFWIPFFLFVLFSFLFFLLLVFTSYIELIISAAQSVSLLGSTRHSTAKSRLRFGIFVSVDRRHLYHAECILHTSSRLSSFVISNLSLFLFFLFLLFHLLPFFF